MTLLRLLFLLLSAFPPNVENYVGLHFFKGYTFSAVNTADDSAPKVICQRLGDIREFVRKAASYSEALLEDATSARYVHKGHFWSHNSCEMERIQTRHRTVHILEGIYENTSTHSFREDSLEPSSVYCTRNRFCLSIP